MKIAVRAPARIDLAGGTLDIHPLHALIDGAVTVNAAISLGVEVRMAPRADGGLLLVSEDLERRLEIDSDEAVQEGEIDDWTLPLRLIRHFLPDGGAEIRIRSEVPAGSGLGGSSALAIALITALVQWRNLPLRKREIIGIAAAAEAAALRTPTGVQDHYPAAYGGFSALWFPLQGCRREALALKRSFPSELHNRLILGYSGVSRFSGANNWEVFKRAFDADRSTLSALREIREAAMRMRQALLESDVERVGNCLRAEWRARVRLTEGIETPETKSLFKSLERAGASAVKICGAGGGGCFLALASDGRRAAVEQAIGEAECRVLDYRFSDSGVQAIE